MINLAVINLKEILKKMTKIIIVALIVTMIFKFIQFFITENIIGRLFQTSPNQYRNIMENSLSIFCFGDVEIRKEKANKSKKILGAELKILSNEDAIMEQENQEEAVEFEEGIVENTEADIALQEEITEAPKENIDMLAVPTSNVETKVIEEKNKKDSYNTTYKSVKIKNESKYALTEEILTPNIEYKNKKDILIFHTHTCESYTATEAENYVSSGNYRTTDLEHSVAKVGSVLETALNQRGYNVVHDKTYHDYPAYTGSYTRSMATVKSILEKNSNIENVIDLHRDAIGNDSSYGPTVKIGDEIVAQLMFVIGTDGGGLNHPNWKQNLKLAVKIQEKANEMYPGLFKPMIVRNSRYNQNLATGANIIEVGATGNTLEECMGSMKYLASVISEVMK